MTDATVQTDKILEENLREAMDLSRALWRLMAGLSNATRTRLEKKSLRRFTNSRMRSRTEPAKRTVNGMRTGTMTDLSNVKARLQRLPLRTIIALTWRIKLARLFLWLARVTDRYDASSCGLFGASSRAPSAAPSRRIICSARCETRRVGIARRRDKRD